MIQISVSTDALLDVQLPEEQRTQRIAALFSGIDRAGFELNIAGEFRDAGGERRNVVSISLDLERLLESHEGSAARFEPLLRHLGERVASRPPDPWFLIHHSPPRTDGYKYSYRYRLSFQLAELDRAWPAWIEAAQKLRGHALDFFFFLFRDGWCARVPNTAKWALERNVQANALTPLAQLIGT